MFSSTTAGPTWTTTSTLEQRLADALGAHRPARLAARSASGRASTATSRSGVGHARGAEEDERCRPRRAKTMAVSSRSPIVRPPVPRSTRSSR